LAKGGKFDWLNQVPVENVAEIDESLMNRLGLIFPEQFRKTTWFS